MSRLIAFAFDDPYKADEARAALFRMEGEGLLEMDETSVIVKKSDGKLRVTQDINTVKKDQKVGHVAGLVAAAVTGTMPLILVGTLGGRLVGKLTDHGITNKFIKDLGKEVTPGTSALIILARSDQERAKKVVERLRTFSPKVMESDLPAEVE